MQGIFLEGVSPNSEGIEFHAFLINSSTARAQFVVFLPYGPGVVSNQTD
jgi:hypothetical protein